MINSFLYKCVSLQLSLNSGRALELLLETHKLFSLLLSVIKTQQLAQLKLKLCNPDSPNSKTPGTPTSADNQDVTVSPQPGQQLEGSEVFTVTCVPYVVSGWCRLVNNLLQAFPDLLVSYVHNYCVVSSLTR